MNNVMFISGVQPSHSVIQYMYLFVFIFFSQLSYYGILSEFPVLYSRSLLVICFKYCSVYISVTNPLMEF